MSDLHTQTTVDTQDAAKCPTTSINPKPQSGIISLITTFIVMLSVVFLLRAYIIKPFIVSGLSMYPTFDSWHYLIVDEFTYNFMHEPKRGDVIVFHYPNDPKRFFIKRVIGLPGETVDIDGYAVSINGGTPLTEPYIIDAKKKRDSLQVTLNNDEYFVLGDNRRQSADSRSWGPLNRKFIVGRALTRLFPIGKINWLPGATTYAEQSNQ